MSTIQEARDLGDRIVGHIQNSNITKTNFQRIDLVDKINKEGMEKILGQYLISDLCASGQVSIQYFVDHGHAERVKAQVPVTGPAPLTLDKVYCREDLYRLFGKSYIDGAGNWGATKRCTSKASITNCLLFIFSTQFAS